MTEGQNANARRLCNSTEIGNWDARNTVDRLDVVELHCVDDEVKTVGQLLRLVRCRRSFGHGSLLCFLADLLFRSVQVISVLTYMFGEPHRVLAHQRLSKSGVAPLQRLDNVHVIDHRPHRPIRVTDCPVAD